MKIAIIIKQKMKVLCKYLPKITIRGNIKIKWIVINDNIGHNIKIQILKINYKNLI